MKNLILKMYKCYAGRTNGTGRPHASRVFETPALECQVGIIWMAPYQLFTFFSFGHRQNVLKSFLSLNELTFAIKAISTWILLTVHLNSIFDWT